MKRVYMFLLFFIAIFSSQILAQGYAWKDFRETRIEPYAYSDSYKGIVIKETTHGILDSIIYTPPFGPGTRYYAPNGLLGLTTEVDTVVIDTTSGDTIWSSDALTDSILMVLEKFVGLSWAVIDTITWTKLSDQSSTTQYLIPRTHHGIVWYYKTAPGDTTTSNIGSFPSDVFRVRMEFFDALSDSNWFVNKLWWNEY